MNRDDQQQSSVNLKQQTGQSVRLSGLYEELEHILERSELLAAAGSDDQIHEMADSLAAIRSLLANLLDAGSRPGSGQDAAVLDQLVERFLSIEGKVKEIRNDRAPRGNRN